MRIRQILITGLRQSRGFAGTDTLKDKEKGDERIYFTKQDGKSFKRASKSMVMA